MNETGIFVRIHKWRNNYMHTYTQTEALAPVNAHRIMERLIIRYNVFNYPVLHIFSDSTTRGRQLRQTHALDHSNGQYPP